MTDPYDQLYYPAFEPTLMRQGLEDRAHDERGGPVDLAHQQIPAEGTE